MTDYILLGDKENNGSGAKRQLVLEAYKTKTKVNYGYKSLDRGELVYRGRIEIPSVEERTKLGSADTGTEERRKKTPFESLEKILGIKYTTSGGHITFDCKGTNTSYIVIKSPVLNKVKKLTEAYNLNDDEVAPMVRK